ncbi:hypothetical protein FBY05_1082 [Pseudomonas sp. SJZ083]|nr:hypothetical protein FBY05_1082 [Pseudomonas sp. SJZ083]TWC48144.1 hypothetical protein FBY01_108247 [Pseudomonas sp. SJZ077]
MRCVNGDAFAGFRSAAQPSGSKLPRHSMSSSSGPRIVRKRLVRHPIRRSLTQKNRDPPPRAAVFYALRLLLQHSRPVVTAQLLNRRHLGHAALINTGRVAGAVGGALCQVGGAALIGDQEYVTDLFVLGLLHFDLQAMSLYFSSLSSARSFGSHSSFKHRRPSAPLTPLNQARVFGPTTHCKHPGNAEQIDVARNYNPRPQVRRKRAHFFNCDGI